MQYSIFLLPAKSYSSTPKATNPTMQSKNTHITHITHSKKCGYILIFLMLSYRIIYYIEYIIYNLN